MKKAQWKDRTRDERYEREGERTRKEEKDKEVDWERKKKWYEYVD